MPIGSQRPTSHPFLKERCSEKTTSPALLIDHTRHNVGPPLIKYPVESLFSFGGRKNNRVRPQFVSLPHTNSTTCPTTSVLWLGTHAKSPNRSPRSGRG